MQSTRRTFLSLPAAFAVIAIVPAARTPAPERGDLLVYFGTYTNQESKGIYVSRLNVGSGALTAPQLAAETASPSFLAAHPSRPLLYAVNEAGAAAEDGSGSVSAFGIDRPSGTLTFLNSQSSRGRGPAHLSVDKAGRNVLVANYGGGSVAVLPIDADGRLKPASAFVQHKGSSVDPERQKEPHAHAINVDASARRVYVADLGLDEVLIYRFDPMKGALSPNDPPFARVRPGAGPRHLAVHANGRVVYVINEMACTITAFEIDRLTGGLKELQTLSTLPPGQKVERGYSTAEILLHPSGRYLYGSNRGHDTIAVFAVDAATGRLTLVQHEPTQGSTPRGFGIDPGGTYLLAANQRSDSVVEFRIDVRTGRLAATGRKIEVDSPVSVEFVR